ncbi:MAG TPA: response regulator [Planctomycetota bacterium]|jgi:DNA-binding response OmpR family regulator|nr:response regulator [Planctomycetota bacterium]
MTSGAPRTILIAEDTAAIRHILSFMLRSRGYIVIEASNGNDALDIALTRSPDLIMLDVIMPGRTGFDICSYLKSDARWKTIPILILTSVTRGTGKSDEEWKRLSNADDFVTKPFKARDLIERIERLLRVGAASTDTSRLERSRGPAEEQDPHA